MKKKIILALGLALLLTSCNKKTSVQKSIEKTQKQMLSTTQKCVYEIDGQTITSYMKQGKIRTDMGDSQTISDGEYIWTWSESKKSGQKFKATNEYGKDMGDVRMPTKEELEDMEEMTKQMQEEYKGSCQKASISDDMFVPPSDITWMDYEDQAEKMDQLTEKYLNSDEAKQNQEEMNQMLKDALKDAGAKQ